MSVQQASTSGKARCARYLAVNDQREAPMFIDVATFGPGATACAEHLSKGRQVGVIGRLSYSEWEGKDGKKRSKHEVVGRVSFGGKSDDVPAGEGESNE